MSSHLLTRSRASVSLISSESASQKEAAVAQTSRVLHEKACRVALGRNHYPTQKTSMTSLKELTATPSNTNKPARGLTKQISSYDEIKVENERQGRAEQPEENVSFGVAEPEPDIESRVVLSPINHGGKKDDKQTTAGGHGQQDEVFRVMHSQAEILKQSQRYVVSNRNGSPVFNATAHTRNNEFNTRETLSFAEQVVEQQKTLVIKHSQDGRSHGQTLAQSSLLPLSIHDAMKLPS